MFVDITKFVCSSVVVKKQLL